MAKLSERQKKNIVSAYAAGGISQKELAKKYGVSEDTVQRLVKKDRAFAEKCGTIKKEAEEEAAKDLVKAIADRRTVAEGLLDDILQAAKVKVATAPLRDLMGAAKILSETFIGGEKAPDVDDDKTFTVVICDNGGDDGDKD